MDGILVTGAAGQIGSDLTEALRRAHPEREVVGLDLERPRSYSGAFEKADVRDAEALRRVVEAHDIGAVYHLASLLSVTGERAPDRAWEVNMYGLKHVLDLAREKELKVFWPSSIAVFGPATPRDEAPQDAPLDPHTMYGVTKVSGELLCRYYHRKYGVDVRSLRYPGLISHTAPPGGGTTDYAVEMCRAAAQGEAYTCFLRPSTRLPMMHMPDAVRAALDLMAVPEEQITVRTSYNIGAVSFSAEELAAALQARVPGFRCTYAPDARQEIADFWPASVDDAPARADWGWRPAFDLDDLVEDMLEKLRAQQSLEV